jgi:hypothetical protein
LLISAIGLLSACKNPATVSDPANNIVNTPNVSSLRKFETAIARSILDEVHRQYPDLPDETRLNFLNTSFEQLDRSVNFEQTDRATRRERDIFAYLIASEEARQARTFAATVQHLSSLNWPLTRYESALGVELTMLKQTIAALQSSDTATLESTSAGAVYPKDTFDGRQEYLDQLADEMVAGQLKWFDTINVYPESQIGFEGFEDTDANYVFAYSNLTLRINLTRVNRLPAYEIAPVALYYGFPGIHSLVSNIPDTSLQIYLELPGHTLGWATYIGSYLGTRDQEAPLEHLSFEQLQLNLAWVDLNLHAGAWQEPQANTYLAENSPYTPDRIELMVKEVLAKPGYQLAAFGGKLTLRNLHDDFLAHYPGANSATFHQRVIDLGPMPFNLLERALIP